MTNFFTHLTREETWSIAADFNHIVHPTDSPTQSQIEHKDPSFWDRVGGCVFLVLMTPLVVPVILYLYWAGRKVEHIDEENSKKAESRIDEYVQQHPVFLGIGNEEQDTDVQVEIKTEGVNDPTDSVPLPQAKKEQKVERQSRLKAALLAFGPGKNKEAAQKAVQDLEKENLLTPEFRSFLLEEAINHNQVDKVKLLLSIKKEVLEKPDEASKNPDPEILFDLNKGRVFLDNPKELPRKSNIELFQLSKPIPLHRLKSFAMADMLGLLGANMVDHVDEEGNIALHLMTNPEVFGAFSSAIPIFGTSQKNNYGETPVITQLTFLESLVTQRDQATTVEEWKALNDQIKNTTFILNKLLDPRNLANVFPNNRKGYNALHLCASIGDAWLEKVVSDCNGKKWNPQKEQLSINSVAVIDGTSYTCYDLALQRLHSLKESHAQWVNRENNSKILENISREILSVRTYIHSLIPAYANPYGDNNYPLHRLVEMGEFNILKKMKLKEEVNAPNLLNSQNKNGETPLVLALKKLSHLLQKKPSNEEEKKVWESQVKIQRKFIKFFLKYEHQIYKTGIGWTKKTSPIMAVNLPDHNGQTALRLCIDIGEPALVKSLVDHPKFEVSSLAVGDGIAPLTVALNYLKEDSAAYKESKEFKENQEQQPIAVPTKEEAEASLQLETSFKELELRVQKEEEVVVILLSKASESASPEVLKALLEKMRSENSLPLLSFLEQHPSLLQGAFNKLKEIEIKIDEKTKKLKKAIGWAFSIQPKIDDLKKKLQDQKEVINILIEYNLTKGKNYYPIFDVLERNDPELIKNLVNSENFDINASEKSPFHAALNTLVDLNRSYDYFNTRPPQEPVLNVFGMEVHKGITQEEIDEEKRILEEKIRNQKEIIRIIGNKKPHLSDSFLPLCISLKDFFLLEKVLGTEGVNVNYLSYYEYNQQKPPLGFVLQDFMKLQKEPSTPEVEEKKESLRSMVRLLVDHGADQELLEPEEKTLLAEILK